MTDPQRKDHELSRVYSEGAWPEPRRQIDDAILEASRRAARARHPVLHRWGPPFALAATVVVGVSLALLVTDHQSVREMSHYFSAAAPEAPAPQRKRDAAAAPKTPAAPAEEPPARELFASPMGPNAPAAKAGPPAANAQTPGAKAPAPAAKAPAAKAPAPAAKAPAPAAKAPAQAQALRSPAPPPDPQRADRIRRELDQLEEKRKADEVAPAQPQAPVSSATVSDIRSLAATPAVGRQPEPWLDDIRKLKGQGRAADAERELAEFRKRYPDYRIPDDLR
jgi:hypothetical protein